jgi:hypothetical protein
MKLIAWVVVGMIGLPAVSQARAGDPPAGPPASPTAGPPGEQAAPAPAPWDQDDPPSEPPASDEPAAPDDNAPPAPPPRATRPRTPPPPEPVPPRHRARMSVSPRSHLSRSRVEEDEGRLEKQEDTVLGGKHFRVKTARGAVHVWVPPDYDRETAGTVIYVHGYYTDADGAWREHDLARQFKASRQNAMFIVPDAPASNDDEVQWPALKDLRRAVTRANIHLPDGPVVVIGHSGAFRTVMQWVDHRLVDQIILLDALYAGEAAFDEFIASGKRADDHKLIVVAASTAEESSSFARRYKFAVARERMPSTVGGFSRRERGAKLLYIRSQFEHMAIVTSGKVIPMLLRVTPLKAL